MSHLVPLSKGAIYIEQRVNFIKNAYEYDKNGV